MAHFPNKIPTIFRTFCSPNFYVPLTFPDGVMWGLTQNLNRFSRFDIYWIQTDRQRNRRADKQSLFIIDGLHIFIIIFDLTAGLSFRSLEADCPTWILKSLKDLDLEKLTTIFQTNTTNKWQGQHFIKKKIWWPIAF